MQTWLDSIGDRNPQFLREIKERWQIKGVLTAIVLSLLGQFLLLWLFWNSWESSPSQYCVYGANECLKNADGNFVIDWKLWWYGVFLVLNWILPLLILALGIYMLATDLQQEERRGTLNFIRLSPRSSQSILLGKLLGVPILLYLGIALALPLHWIAAIGADAPISFLLSYYILLIGEAFLSYSLALLVGFSGRIQPGSGSQSSLNTAAGATVLIVLTFLPAYILWKAITVWHNYSYIIGAINEPNSYWFYLPLTNEAIANSFILINLGILSLWVWQALRRYFDSPGITLLSKAQSYGIVVYVQLLTIGFRVPMAAAIDDYVDELRWISLQTLVGFLILISVLTPHRQTVLDWLHTRRIGMDRSSLLKSLIRGEKSPAIAAIVLNLALVAILTFLRVGFWSDSTLDVFSPHVNSYVEISLKGEAFLALVLLFNSIALYALLAQLMLMLKTPRRAAWAMGVITIVLLLPLICSGILAIGGNYTLAQLFLLLSPIPWAGIPFTTDRIIYGVMLGQWAMFGFLLWQFLRRLERLEQVRDVR